MSFASSSLRVFRLVTVVALLVAVPLFFYWTFFMSRRLDDWQRTNVALLASVARALEARIGQERSVATDSEIDTTEYLASLPRGELMAADAEPAARKPVSFVVEDHDVFIEFARAAHPWRVRFAKLFPSDLDTDFDAVMVVDHEGRLLHLESRDTQLELGASIPFARADGRSIGFAELAAGAHAPVEVPQDGKPKGIEATSLRDRLLGIAEVPRTRLDTGEQLVYARIVRLPGPETEVAVLGLVGTTRLIRHAVRLSSIALTWIFALVMAVFLAIPYLKIRCLGRYEPLRAIDIWQLALFALLGTGIATLLMLQIGAQAHFRASADAALQDFAHDVSMQVREEIDAAYAQLLASAPAIAASPPGARGRVLASDETFAHYPYFEALLFTDRERQVRKWMSIAVPTPMVRMDGAPWFVRTKWLREGGGNPFVFDSIVASNSARDLAVIATPGRLTDGAPELGPQVPFGDRTGVAAVATSMLSLRDPVTPFGFEFVVIGEDDRVAFRSGAKRNAREVFYDHVDEGARLRARAQSAKDRPLDAQSMLDFRYRGRMHRGVVTWLPQASMALVAYYDKDMIESPAGHVFMIGLAWLAVLTLVCVTAAAVTRWLHPRATDWAWPSARFHSVYLLGCLVFAALAALVFWSCWARPRWWSPYALLGIPAAAIVALPLLPLAWLADRVHSLESRWRWAGALRRVYPHSYVLAGVSALIALIAVPMTIVHFDALNAHRAGLALRVQRAHERAVKARVAAWNGLFVDAEELEEMEEMREAGLGIAVKASDRERLVPPRFGIYEPALAESIRREAPLGPRRDEPACGTLFAFDRERLPRLYFSNALAPCLSWVGASGVVPKWALFRADAIGVDPGPRSIGVLSLASRTALPGLVLALVLGFFVRSVSRRILGLQLEGDGVVDRSSELDALQRALLLRPSPPRVAELADAIKAQTGKSFDLADPDLSLDSVLAVPAGVPLLLIGVEARLGDPADRAKLLEILERPRHDRRLLLVTAIDPLYFLGVRLAEANAADPPAKAEAQPAPEREAELGRWARALDGVERIRFDLPSNMPVAPVVAVRKGLLVQLRKECEWDDRLLEVERSLLLRGDLDRFDWEQMVDYVQDAAEPHYRFLWSLCSMEERRVLRQLAAEGFVNPHFFDVLRRLRRRRLVRVDPRIRVACESFRRFVCDERPSASELAWEQKLPKAATSDRIRGPLLVVGALAVALLALTQAELVNSALATATTVVGTLGAVASVALRTRQIGTSSS